MFDDSDSEDDLEDLNGGDGGWIDADREVIDANWEVIDEDREVIDADREVIDADREVIDEEDLEDGSEGEGDEVPEFLKLGSLGSRIQTDRQTDRPTDRQTDRQTD